MTATDAAPDGTPLWQAIERLRKERGWSMAELGRRSGVQPPLIYKWKTNPASADSVRKIASGFDLAEDEVRELLILAGRLRPEEVAAPQTLDDLEAAIRAEPSFTEQQKDALIATARAFRQANRQHGNEVDPS